MNFGRNNNEHQPQQQPTEKPAETTADGGAGIMATGRPVQAGAATIDEKPAQTAPSVGVAPSRAAGSTNSSKPAQKKPTEQEQADQELVGLKYENAEVVEVLHYNEAPNAVHARMSDNTTKHIPFEVIERAKSDRAAHLAANPVKE